VLNTLVTVLALALAAPALAQPEPESPPADDGAAAPSVEELQGVWAYDFDHLAARDDIAELAESGRLKHILDFQGRTTWEFDGDVLAVRTGSTFARPLKPTTRDGRLITNIDDARHAVPATLRWADDGVLVAGFAEFDEHPAFRFVRHTFPGSDAVGRWTGEGEHGDVRLVVSESNRVLLTGAGERMIAQADIEADGDEHRLALQDDGRTTLRLTIDDDLASATLDLPGAKPIPVRRSYDPMAWIEASWLIEPEATRALPFYGIWPEAFGNPAPPLERMSAFFVRDGLHLGSLSMKPHSVRGDVIVYQVGEGEAASLLPFERLGDDRAETLILKLVLSAERQIDDHDHAGHDHAGHDHAGHDHAGHDHSGHDHDHEH